MNTKRMSMVLTRLLTGSVVWFAFAAVAGEITNVRFESNSSPDGKRLVVVCAKATSTTKACGLDFLIAKAAAPEMSLEFAPLAARQAYLAQLAREAAESQISSPVDVEGILPGAPDLGALRQVAKDATLCFAEKNNADLMLACPTGKPFEDPVVMLFRGLCDRCRFEPIVVRKVN